MFIKAMYVTICDVNTTVVERKAGIFLLINQALHANERFLSFQLTAMESVILSRMRAQLHDVRETSCWCNSLCFSFFLSQNKPPHKKCLLLYKRLKMDDINYHLDSFAFQGAIRPMTNLLTRPWLFRRNDVIKISKSVMKSNHNKKTFRSLSLSPRLDCFWGQAQHVWLSIIARMIERSL